MANHCLQFGFEYEVISSIPESELAKKLKKVFPEYSIKDSIYMREGLRNVICITSEYSTRVRVGDLKEMNKHSEKRIVNYDLIGGIELVFPVMTEAKALKIIHLMETEFFNLGILRINKTCGLHVNVSFRSKKIHSQVDLAKLAIAFDVPKWKKIFDRSKNSYCLNWMTPEDVRSSYSGTDGNADFYLDHLHQKLINKVDKYNAINTINFDKDDGVGRIEFRVAGGPNAMNSKLMTRLIKDIHKSMEYASFDINERNVIRKINKLLAA